MNELNSKVGNWGRWGKDDERGAANFASTERIQNAASSLVRKGKVYSLAIPLQTSDVPVLPPRVAPQHFMRLDGGDYAAGLKRKGGFQTSDDFIALGTHTTTHIDALAHVWYDDRLYNGFSANTVRSNGAKHCGIDKLVHLVGRGVLIDLCAQRALPHLPSGEVIKPEQIEACAKAQGVELHEGDILLLRTGWMEVFRKEGRDAFFQGEPGIGRESAEWIGRKGFAAVGADNWGVEAIPVEGDIPGPVHRRLIRDFGVSLMELFNLDELAADRVYEFLFVAAPLRITGGVGSPLNPLAIA
jgi:kynurenine formamidase